MDFLVGTLIREDHRHFSGMIHKEFRLSTVMSKFPFFQIKQNY